MHMVLLSQVEDSALALVELHQVSLLPALQSVQILQKGRASVLLRFAVCWELLLGHP